MALCGFAPVYGRMTPYLHEIDLEEHYFIQGPSHSRTEVILHFAKLGKDNSISYFNRNTHKRAKNLLWWNISAGEDL